MKSWEYDITPLHERFLKETCSKIKGFTLDVGCGPGYALRYMNGIGVDINPECKPNIVSNAFELPFKNGTFDNVYCSHVIEHLTKDQGIRLIEEAERVLKSGGRLYLYTSNIKSDFNTFYDEFTHITPYTKKSLRELVECYTGLDVSTCKAGFGPIMHTGFGRLSRALPFMSYLLMRLNNLLLLLKKTGLALEAVK